MGCELGEWRELPPGVYRCPVNLSREADGSWFAVAANLPGATSDGDTMVEVLENIKEALVAVIEMYLDDGTTIPWLSEPRPAEIGESWRAWVFVQTRRPPP